MLAMFGIIVVCDYFNELDRLDKLNEEQIW